MKEFAFYSEYVENLITSLRRDGEVSTSKLNEIEMALNGGPYRALRSSVPVARRKELGSFFSGRELTKRLLPETAKRLKNFYDPACGVGDLLIVASNRLPILKSLNQTLRFWGERLFAHDVEAEFVRAAKARLVLAAIRRTTAKGGSDIALDMDEVFPNIAVGDSLSNLSVYGFANEILINPPFFRTLAPPGCGWSRGKVSAAAIFLDTCVRNARPGTKIHAILPDVLRSGTLYATWRDNISSFATVESSEVFGQFDSWTDVSVFLLHLTLRKNQIDVKALTNWWPASVAYRETISDHFDVSVGSVVPYRAPHEGNLLPYIQPKGLARWTIVRDVAERRHFLGRAVQAPFVVVRRNSRFEDTNRAAATVIGGDKKYVIENHLIVLKPKNGKFKTCVRLMEILRLEETNDLLNARIRCRHLTLPAIKELPWIP